jgi:isochorismate synthase/2-succinyl-5-enolpyruvyl-6-hydroxy-3-cyclohexene-1-carboxylate synthase/2-succinyl-6-hydroxy-2,4-cyclohexadiene-1-carboxylate synthase/O-succinylbenzoate synthase
VEKEIHSKLSMGVQLTEPFVARMVMETLSPGSALFLGNSMPIRDADMYATSSVINHGRIESIIRAELNYGEH